MGAGGGSGVAPTLGIEGDGRPPIGEGTVGAGHNQAPSTATVSTTEPEIGRRR